MHTFHGLAPSIIFTTFLQHYIYLLYSLLFEDQDYIMFIYLKEKEKNILYNNNFPLFFPIQYLIIPFAGLLYNCSCYASFKYYSLTWISSIWFGLLLFLVGYFSSGCSGDLEPNYTWEKLSEWKREFPFLIGPCNWLPLQPQFFCHDPWLFWPPLIYMDGWWSHFRRPFSFVLQQCSNNMRSTLA